MLVREDLAQEHLKWPNDVIYRGTARHVFIPDRRRVSAKTPLVLRFE
jgi:hypothetical protein